MDFFKDFDVNKIKDKPRERNVEEVVENQNGAFDIKKPQVPVLKIKPTHKAAHPKSDSVHETTTNDDAMHDLYNNDDWRKELESESESLKQLVTYDVLKFYARIRTIFTDLGQRLAIVGDIFSTIKLTFMKLSSRNRKLVMAGVATLVVLGIGGTYFMNAQDTGEQIAVGANSEGEVLAEDAAPVDPTFDTLKPKNSTSQPVGVVADGQVASLKDQIDGIEITVSQQSIPSEVKEKEFGLQGLAESLNGEIATKKFVVDGSDVFTVDLSNGSQIAVFTLKDVLLFIRAGREIPEESWVAYISNIE